MLLLNNTRAHWQMVAQMLQAAENPMLSPMQKDYLLQTVQAGNLLMIKIAKDFGILDPSAIIPDPAGIEVAATVAHQTAEHTMAQQIAQQIQQSQQQQGGQQQQPQQGQQPPQGKFPAQTGGQAPPEGPVQ